MRRVLVRLGRPNLSNLSFPFGIMIPVRSIIVVVRVFGTKVARVDAERGGEQRGVGRRGGAAILAHIGGIFGEAEQPREDQRGAVEMLHRPASVAPIAGLGSASGRESVGQYGSSSGV